MSRFLGQMTEWAMTNDVEVDSDDTLLDVIGLEDLVELSSVRWPPAVWIQRTCFEAVGTKHAWAWFWCWGWQWKPSVVSQLVMSTLVDAMGLFIVFTTVQVALGL